MKKTRLTLSLFSLILASNAFAAATRDTVCTIRNGDDKPLRVRYVKGDSSQYPAVFENDEYEFGFLRQKDKAGHPSNEIKILLGSMDQADIRFTSNTQGADAEIRNGEGGQAILTLKPGSDVHFEFRSGEYRRLVKISCNELPESESGGQTSGIIEDSFSSAVQPERAHDPKVTSGAIKHSPALSPSPSTSDPSFSHSGGV